MAHNGVRPAPPRKGPGLEIGSCRAALSDLENTEIRPWEQEVDALQGDPVDLLEALCDLDAALVLIGASSGTRVAATVTLDRRHLLDDLLGGPSEDRESAWLELLDDIDTLLPGELSLWSLHPGQVVTLPVRAALQRMIAP